MKAREESKSMIWIQKARDEDKKKQETDQKARDGHRWKQELLIFYHKLLGIKYKKLQSFQEYIHDMQLIVCFVR